MTAGIPPLPSTDVALRLYAAAEHLANSNCRHGALPVLGCRDDRENSNHKSERKEHMKAPFLLLLPAILILNFSCGERKETMEVAKSEISTPAEEAVPQETTEPEKVYTDEERANEFLRGTWIGSENGDFYIFTGSELIKQKEDGRIVIRAGYKVFFADETEIGLKLKNGSKGTILRMGDELLFGGASSGLRIGRSGETLKKHSESTTLSKSTN